MTCKPILKLSCCSYVIRQMSARVTIFQEWLVTDLWPCRVTYPEWISTNLQRTYDRKGINCELVTRNQNWQVSWPFLTIKNGHGTCRFQWWVHLSYCEYSGVTYDLLVSDIGRTYDLVNQLQSNCHFGNYVLGSQSQVHQKFGVNLA